MMLQWFIRNPAQNNYLLRSRLLSNKRVKYNNVLSVANTDEIREQAIQLFVFMFFLMVDVNTRPEQESSRKRGSLPRFYI